MDLYKRVRKLPFLQPFNYRGIWIELLGQFHICLCYVRCLGDMVEGSGLDTAWVEANIYSNVTAIQIINGKHYKRAIECHIITLEALSDLWWDAFFERYPETLVAVKHNLKNLGSAVKREIGIAEAHKELVDKDEGFFFKS